MLIYVKDEDGNSVASGERFFWASVVLGIAALITILICWKWSVERVRLADKDKSEVKKSSNTKAVILDCFKDKALLSSFGFQIFMYAAIQIFFAFNQYMFLDYFQSTALSGLASVVMFFGMILTAPITVPLAKKFGKKEVSIVGLAISVVSYIVIFVTRVTSPYVYLVLIFFAFFGIGIMSMVSYAMTNDCVDNHYLETGDRVEGTVYAMASFVRKMAGAVCTGIGGWALTWIGYNELAVTQTEEVRQALFNIIVGLPLLCFALTLIFMLFYPLNKKRVEENEKKMEALRSKEQA
jgi:GPH family glycoside/pentoside/hexuronide:cation symporter